MYIYVYILFYNIQARNDGFDNIVTYNTSAKTYLYTHVNINHSNLKAKPLLYDW